MLSLAAKAIKLIETFLVQASPLWVGLGVIVLGILGFEGMVTYNQTTLFCMKCHEARGIYVSFDPDDESHVPYKRDQARCLKCHTDKDFYTFAGKLFGAAQDVFAAATSEEPAQLPPFGAGYADDQCIACHYNVLNQDKGEKLELPPRLAAVGLTFSHRRHFWLRDYPPEAAARLAALKKKTILNEDEKKEWEFLQRAQLGRCGQCHDREQTAANGRAAVNRNINFFSINPMRCESCHLDATPDRHPGTIHLALPREETCRRCHTGSFHGRFAVFRAQCDSPDKRDCTRCHPDYRPNPDEAGPAYPMSNQ